MVSRTWSGGPLLCRSPGPSPHRRQNRSSNATRSRGGSDRAMADSDFAALLISRIRKTAAKDPKEVPFAWFHLLVV